jgi:hypothetical protein
MSKTTLNCTIDTDLAPIARSLPNFSAFVQECLRMYSEGELDIDMSKLQLRTREGERLQYETKIEKRLTNIEEIITKIFHPDLE